LLGDQPLLEQLLLDPHRDCHAEGLKATWGKGEIGLQQALELEKGLVVEGHEIEGLQAHPGPLQAIFDGVPGKVGVVLLAGEALLLRRSEDAAVLDRRRRGVVIEGRDT
jgi:hypothetical protein